LERKTLFLENFISIANFRFSILHFTFYKKKKKALHKYIKNGHTYLGIVNCQLITYNL
jgi:hypothetical protein